MCFSLSWYDNLCRGCQDASAIFTLLLLAVKNTSAFNFQLKVGQNKLWLLWVDEAAFVA